MLNFKHSKFVELILAQLQISSTLNFSEASSTLTVKDEEDCATLKDIHSNGPSSNYEGFTYGTEMIKFVEDHKQDLLYGIMERRTNTFVTESIKKFEGYPDKVDSHAVALFIVGYLQEEHDQYGPICERVAQLCLELAVEDIFSEVKF